MILYKKVFPLDEGISFSDYINALRKEHFPNFVLTIDRIPPTENYRAEIFFTAPLWKWGVANAFPEGVLLRECIIQYPKEERYFTLQASPKTGNLVFVLFQSILALMFFVFGLLMAVTKDSMSLNDMFIFVIITILILAPSVSIYIRDANFLDKIGSLGTELEKNNS
jgi:hypothetical protein